MIGINPFEGLWGTFDDPSEDFQKMKAIIPAIPTISMDEGISEVRD